LRFDSLKEKNYGAAPVHAGLSALCVFMLAPGLSVNGIMLWRKLAELDISENTPICQFLKSLVY
jgi:hypothetical protein